jgi:hypothetical protein
MTPAVGGLLSMTTPSDVTEVHRSAVLQAVTVVKYLMPYFKRISDKVNSEKI